MYNNSGPYRHVKMPPVVLQAIGENILGSYELKHGFGMRNAAQQMAAAYWASLLQDAGAELEWNLSAEIEMECAKRFMLLL